jgi:hypothetical protein
VSNLRTKNRRSLNYASGLVYFSTQGAASTNKYKKNQEYVALLPRDKFLDVFQYPSAALLAGRFETRARELVKEWNQTNLRPGMYGRRYPVQKVFTLFSHQWRSKVHFGVTERAGYELGLNTYGFTQQQLHAEFPEPVALKDIKASNFESAKQQPERTKPLFLQLLLKLKTTVGSDDHVDKSGIVDGFNYDNYAYNVSCPHFFNLLRSDKFNNFVKEVLAEEDQDLAAQGLPKRPPLEEAAAAATADDEICWSPTGSAASSVVSHPSQQNAQRLLPPSNQRVKQQLNFSRSNSVVANSPPPLLTPPPRPSKRSLVPPPAAEEERILVNGEEEEEEEEGGARRGGQEEEEEEEEEAPPVIKKKRKLVGGKKRDVKKNSK